jgi:hypothetical protein
MLGQPLPPHGDGPLITTLKELVGKCIVARIPALDKENSVFVRLHKVETTGIWIESKTFNQEMLDKLEMAVSFTTLVLFVPFCGIDYIIGSVDSITLSEAAFGVGE